MEKLEKKDIIELILLVIILIIVSIIIFKTLVISSIIGKANYHEEVANAFERVEFENSDKVKSYNIYKKNNIVKAVIYTQKNTKLTKYQEYTSSSYALPNGETNKELEEYNKREFNITLNYFDTQTIWDIINKSMIVSIKSEKTDDGKKCFVFGKLYDKQTLEENGISEVKLYIDKDSGLPTQKVEINKDGSTNTIKFSYEFGNVSDRDVKIPLSQRT